MCCSGRHQRGRLARGCLQTLHAEQGVGKVQQRRSEAK